MNRHERRAVEAQTRNSFKDYDALDRRAFKKVDDRDIGESWRRSRRHQGHDPAATERSSAAARPM
jgi:hypothetical protein